jgi:hypothetical protein
MDEKIEAGQRDPQSGILDHRNVRSTLTDSWNVLGYAPGFALGRLPRVRVMSEMAMLRQGIRQA